MKIQIDKSEKNESLQKVVNPISSISWNIFKLNEIKKLDEKELKTDLNKYS